ncbi:FadR/GntR family transcriptional regulator [Paenarthrobacter sp. NPDC090520]|uniref:FadR/GntR family transcriptional regulator n=1 Tax=unclassified Paenarthrobacter TaxID=2634190 RepID=UPI00380B3BC5
MSASQPVSVNVHVPSDPGVPLKSSPVVESLERQILSGFLAAGTVLPPEPELCRSLGISRTVLRDAVRSLVARGLLDVRQGRGTIVTEPSAEPFSEAMVALLARSGLSMREVLQTRGVIETLLAEAAAKNGTGEDWARLDAAYTALRLAVAQGDMVQAELAHSAFHAGILMAAHQPVLALLLGPMSQITLVTGAAAVEEGSPEAWETQAHLTILGSLKRGDAQAAANAMRKHFEQAMHPRYDRFLDRPFGAAFFG